jgi:hypothetical protein
MAGESSESEGSERGPTLLGRRPELKALGDLLAAVGTGASRALVLRGEPGIGKSALLEAPSARAGAAWSVSRESNRRGSWRSPDCTSCAPR